jgi:hypothetical protein
MFVKTFNWFTGWDVYENSLIGSNFGSSMLDAVKESHTLTQRKKELRKNVCKQVTII